MLRNIMTEFQIVAEEIETNPDSTQNLYDIFNLSISHEACK